MHTPAVSLEDCFARLEEQTLVVGNGQIERRWQIVAGRLHASAFVDRSTGRNWFEGVAPQPSILPPGAVDDPAASSAALSVATDRSSPVSAPSLLATLTIGTLQYRFRVFAADASITMQLVMPARAAASHTNDAAETHEPSGIEADDKPKAPDAALADVLDRFTLRPGHHRLTQVTLLDQTDVHCNLAHENSFFLESPESRLRLAGNLFFVEDVLSGDGFVFLKHAPLPHARPVKNEADLDVRNAREITLLGHGTDDGGEGYALATIAYTGGRVGRIAALHAHQRQYRPYVPGRDGLFQSNTWGDRSRDARVTDEFIRAEIAAGAKLGVDIMQVDDGWQTGKTSNWADSAGGVWEGYWSVSKSFWQPNPARFPNGLRPVVAAARAAGVNFGLWYSPDSADHFAHWNDDADTLLGFHRDVGVRFFKIDGVKAVTKAGERNLMRMFDKVLNESAGRVSFDLDVTAEIRPGYFGAMHVGPLFVQNRYTDWRRYFPHHTLRTLWTLAQYIDPVRVRMEFLNHARNTEKYAGDPLRPDVYRPDYLFATVMFASPLGWFEVSNLPETYLLEAGPLIAEWKQHRDAIFAGRIIPIGDMPDGASWTGFVSASEDRAHLLVFRGLNDEPQKTFDLRCANPRLQSIRKRGGDGEARRDGSAVIVSGIEPLRFSWFELTK